MLSIGASVTKATLGRTARAATTPVALPLARMGASALSSTTTPTNAPVLKVSFGPFYSGSLFAFGLFGLFILVAFCFWPFGHYILAFGPQPYGPLFL
jgi:hypothetical protein